MLYRVLKPFTYGPGGVTGRPLPTGELVEIRDVLAPGLAAEGFIAPAPAGMGAPETPAEPASDAPEPTQVPAPTAEPARGATKRKGKFGRFDVFDAEGRKVSKKLLTEAEADAMVARLNAGAGSS